MAFKNLLILFEFLCDFPGKRQKNSFLTNEILQSRNFVMNQYKIRISDKIHSKKIKKIFLFFKQK